MAKRSIKVVLTMLCLMAFFQTTTAQYEIKEMSSETTIEFIKTNLTPINDSVGVIRSEHYFYYYNLLDTKFLAVIDIENKQIDLIGVYGFDYWLINYKETRKAVKQIKKSLFTIEKADIFLTLWQPNCRKD